MITRNYIVAYDDIPLTANIPDAKVSIHINPALKELRDVLPAALYSDLRSLYDEGVKEWSATNAYVATNKVVHHENYELKMWVSATTNSNSEPTTANSTNWTEKQLGTFLVGYVQPYLAHQVFYFYAVNGGVNVTHQGLQQIQNETAQPLTGTALSAFLNHWKQQTERARNVMFNYLADNNSTLDGTGYTQVESYFTKQRFNIRAIGY